MKFENIIVIPLLSPGCPKTFRNLLLRLNIERLCNYRSDYRSPYSQKDKRCANNVKHSAKLLGTAWTVKQDPNAIVEFICDGTRLAGLGLGFSKSAKVQ